MSLNQAMSLEEKARHWLHSDGRDLYGSHHQDSLVRLLEEVTSQERERAAMVCDYRQAHVEGNLCTLERALEAAACAADIRRPA